MAKKKATPVQPGKTVNVNGIEVPFAKLPKEIREAIEKAEAEKERRRKEREELAKLVPFTVDKLGQVRKELEPFGKSLMAALNELAKVGIKFTEMQRSGQEVYGQMGKYKVALTLEYSDEVFPKPVVVASVRNIAEGDCVIEHAWSAFVHKDKFQVFENQLPDYILNQRPDGITKEE